jgi:hypothetical protein
MLADCAAMTVDVVSYFVNFMAERLKHGHTSMTPQQIRLRRLYLELIPPGISVITLVVVTALALRLAIKTLVDASKGKGGDTPPDLNLMLLFSGLNLLLDFFNVSCFARADQAVGLPGQHGNEDIHVHFDHHHRHSVDAAGNDETTPLVTKNEEENLDDAASTISSEIETNELNLNMCSAWTVCSTLAFFAITIFGRFNTYTLSLVSLACSTYAQTH